MLLLGDNSPNSIFFLKKKEEIVLPKYSLTAIIKDKKNKIISIGKNSYIKTHPKMVKLANKIGKYNSRKVFIHAEIDAIIKCNNLDKAYTIEIYRVDKSQTKYLCSRPCILCSYGIAETPIKKILFCNEKGEFEITSPNKLIEFWKNKKIKKIF